MTAQEIIEKIRAEIEQMLHSIENCPFISGELGAREKEMGEVMAYKNILSFLSDLEKEEKPINPTIEKLRALIKMQIRREELNFASLGGGGQTMTIGALECVLKQLDTLQEQPSWKPTKEQMEALMLAIEGKCPTPTSYLSRRLEDLYEGLANTYGVECVLQSKKQPLLPGFENEQPGIPGKDFVPVEWVETLEMYGKWKIVKLDEDGSSEIPNDLEEAAKAYADDTNPTDSFYEAFKEGALWMREDLQKEAVEGEVIKTDKHTSVRYKSFYGTYRYFYGIADKQFKPGDKGHIIFVKED